MIYPNFIKPGGTIGICAPSAGVGHKLESFDQSISLLHKQGYKTIETASVRVNDIRPASGKVRAEELHSLFSNPDVGTIIAAAGGEYCIEVLPFLDKQVFINNPKWFCGYSDPTNIEFYLTTKLDIATIYGFNAGGFDWEQLHQFQLDQLNILKGKIVEQTSFEYYDSDRSSNKTQFILDTPVKWELYLPGQSHPSNNCFSATGRVIGGCTDVLSHLIGTPYDGSKEFLDKYANDGFIWYFDTFELSPLELYLTMIQFKYAGLFRNAKAIVMGRVMFPGDATDNEYVDLLQMIFDDIPFIWGADIGHTKPSMTLINGSIGTLNYDGNKATLNMQLK